MSEIHTYLSGNRIVSALLTLLICVAAPASASESRAVALIEMLHAREFTQLTRQLADLQQQYESGEGTDTAVDLAFRALANADPSHQTLLDEWVELMPGHFESYAARGRYLADLGWLMRGGKWAAKTSAQQFRGLHEYHAAAMVDLQKAVTLRPRYIVGYTDILGLKGAVHDEARNAALAAAMEIDPASYELRKTVLGGLQPRWGGSYKQIQRYLAEMRPYIEKNSRLAPLQGYANYDRGYTHATRKQYDRAVDEYSEALSFGDTAWFYTERGVAYRYLDDHERALADFDRAIELWPDSVRALTFRGLTYLDQDRVDEALSDLTRATTLRPLDSRALHYLGRVLAKLERYEEAVQAFEDAAIYAQRPSILWRVRGWYLEHKLKRPAEALKSYRIATQHGPDDPAAWYAYGGALNDALDCEVMTALQHFLQLCESGSSSSCTDARQASSKAVMHSLTSQKKCAAPPPLTVNTEPGAWVAVLTKILQHVKAWITTVFNIQTRAET